MESWGEKKLRCFERDKWTCKRCRRETTKLTLHHIIPRSMYGSNDDENLITLCVGCHNWVELNLEFNPLLKLREGVLNSLPVVQYKIVENYFSKSQVGCQLEGDQIDIWKRWKKDGRKGAHELIAKYGNTLNGHEVKTELPRRIEGLGRILTMNEAIEIYYDR